MDFRFFLRFDWLDVTNGVALSGCIGIDEIDVSSLGALLSDVESSWTDGKFDTFT